MVKNYKKVDPTPGFWVVKDVRGESYIAEVYDHPIKGLCVWFEDYAPGNAGYRGICTDDNDGHIPLGCTEYEFLRFAVREDGFQLLSDEYKDLADVPSYMF